MKTQNVTSRALPGAVAWLLFVHLSALTPVAHAHGQGLIEFLAACIGVIVYMLVALLFLIVRGHPNDKLRFFGVYAAIELTGIGLMSVSSGDGFVYKIGGSIYGFGLFVAPIAGYLWISERQERSTRENEKKP
jgi:hypothetical protein